MDAQTSQSVESWMQRRFQLLNTVPFDSRAYAIATVELVEALRFYDPAYAVALAQESLDTLPPTPPLAVASLMLTLHRQAGHGEFRLGHLENALSHLRHALHLLDHYPTLDAPLIRAQLCHLQALLTMARGDYDLALRALGQAIRYGYTAGNIDEQCLSLVSLSNYYGRIKRADRALDVLNHALRIDPHHTIHPHIRIAIYNNLAWAYFDSGNPDEAVAVIQKGMALAHAYEHKVGMGITHTTLAHFLNRRGDYADAQNHFRDAYQCLQETGYQMGQVKLLMGWATAQWETGDHALAIDTLQDTLRLASIDKIMQAECCEMLSRYYEAMGDTAQALTYHRRFYTLEKTIFNQDSQMRVEKLETVYRTRVAEHEMERYRLRAVEMEEKVHEAQLEILERLAMAGERGADTAAHNRRVCWLAGLVARQLGLSPEEAGAIELASQLHDIGKIAIPDRILGKPSSLTPDEFELVKTHTVIGAEILAQSNIPLLKLAETIALTHHERWDGTGYPKGLRGDEIPLAGRIVAVVDVFDVLISNRPYKQSWMPEVAMAEIRARSGNHFDPRVVEALCNVVLVQTI